MSKINPQKTVLSPDFLAIVQPFCQAIDHSALLQQEALSFDQQTESLSFRTTVDKGDIFDTLFQMRISRHGNNPEPSFFFATFTSDDENTNTNVLLLNASKDIDIETVIRNYLFNITQAFALDLETSEAITKGGLAFYQQWQAYALSRETDAVT